MATITTWLQLTIIFALTCSFGIAHAQSFLEVIVGNDYASLLSAVIVSILGGLFRTAWDLSDRNFAIPLKQVWSEVRGNIIFALVTGFFVHMALEAARPHWDGLSPAMRLLFVFSSGFGEESQ